ncbi:hypothetical protein ACHABX_06215 [Nesterenkonia halotolerans]|uniref:hypothetical protein n=1 Tax=Nesterenkonia halotolerans TaxID=225325 RepID=UPI003EE6E766
MVDLDEIYDGLPYEGDVPWAQYKSEVYEESRAHLAEVLAHTDYAGDTGDAEGRAKPEDIDDVVRAFMHVSYFQYAYAYFNEREIPSMIFDDDYIFLDDDAAHAEVFIVPNPSAPLEVEGDFQEMVDALVEDQRPIELTRSADDTWVIDAGTLAPELAENYLEVGDEFL